MRILTTYLMLVAAAGQVSAALTDKTQLFIETGGDNLNGGGFNPGKTGSNYALGRTTKRSAANGDITDLSVTDAATTAGSSTLTSATANFTSALVGNVVYLAGGTGALAASWYEVVAVTNATTVTLDRTAAATSAEATLNIGGSFADLNAIVPLINIASSSRKLIFLVKSGTYTHSSAVDISDPGNRSPGLFRLVGYKTTPFDRPSGADRPILKFTAGGGGYGLRINAYFKVPWSFEHLVFDGDGTKTKLVYLQYTESGPSYASNCLLRNTTDTGWTMVVGGPFPSFVWNRVESTVGNIVPGAAIIGSYIHDMSNNGALEANCAPLTVINTIVANTSGESGVKWIGRVGSPLNLIGNTFYNTGTFIATCTGSPEAAEVRNNIFACFKATVGGWSASTSYEPYYGHNAYHANTGGNGNMAGTGDVTIAGACNPNSLFIDASNGDFRLNTSGAGASMVGAGTAAIDQRFPIGAAAPDIGAIQVKQSGGGTGSGGGSYPFVN